MNRTDRNQLRKKFEEWKDWEVNVQGDFLSPQDASMLDEDLFVVIAEQKTPYPTDTIWNDFYFMEFEEAAGRFLEWLEKKEINSTPN